MQKKYQIGIIVVVACIMGYLLLQPIGVLRNEPDTADTEITEDLNSVNYTSESLRSKQGLMASIVTEIDALEEKLNSTISEEEKITYLKELATKWDDVNKTSPLGFIYEELAVLENQYGYWFEAGENFRTAYGLIQDIEISGTLKNKAIRAYENALLIEPDNLDAKTGLGSAIVSASENPMAGIALLQEVVETNPKHLGANKSLGLFSMQSRQFDKAITRFQTVIELQPDAESYFYLATSYENIGLKKEAVAAFEKSRELASDPTLNQFIDRKIVELSK